MSSHTRRLVECAWRLGGKSELSHLRLRASAHQLGYRGQVISKSRRYSTTFGALRKVRHDHRLAQAARRRERRGDEPEGLVVLYSWRYAGTGHELPTDHVLAEYWASEQIEIRRELWEFFGTTTVA